MAAQSPTGGDSETQGLSVARVANELVHSEEFIVRAATAAKAAGVNASSGMPLMWAQAADFCDEMAHFEASSADVLFLYQTLLGRGPETSEVQSRRKQPISVLSLTVEILRSDEFRKKSDFLGPVRAKRGEGYITLVSTQVARCQQSCFLLELH